MQEEVIAGAADLDQQAGAAFDHELVKRHQGEPVVFRQQDAGDQHPRDGSYAYGMCHVWLQGGNLKR